MTTAPRASAPDEGRLGGRQDRPPSNLVVGGYELRARLGEGGMGVVHLGQRPGEQPVAIKVLRPHIVGDQEARQRLAREVNSLTRVRSRRIAEIVDADPWGEIPFVATRYVPGLSLHDHVQQEGRLSGEDLLWFADCLAEALEAVHSVGVLHRDVKPSNVLMEGRTPILIDFGLARVADDSRLTMTGWLLGTPGYLAPEILHGEDATAASDIHSWAATVAYAALGRAPFGRGPSMAILDRVRRGEHDLSGLDPTVLLLVEEALHPMPSARPSLTEVREWLEALRGGLSRPVPLTVPLTVPLAAPAEDELTVATRVTHPFMETAESLTVPMAAVDPSWPSERTSEVPGGETETFGSVDDEPRSHVGRTERLRRSVLVLAGGAVVTTAATLAPYVTVLVCVVAVWLLRSASMAASAVGNRRRVRGAKWYDSVQVLLSAPWHLVRSIPGTVLLLLWSLGVAVAFALCCFAASLSLDASLAVVGVGFTVAMWWGPGAERVRAPLHRLVDPVARGPVLWLLATLLVLAGAALVGDAAASNGPDWTPDDRAPLTDLRLPGWL